jgi:hypothetical protein
MGDNEIEAVMSVEEVSERLGVTPQQVGNYLRAGLLRRDPRFRYAVILRESVEAFVKPLKGRPKRKEAAT